MTKTYIQPGEVIDHSPSSAVNSGDVVVIGSRVGVALEDIPAGGSGSVSMEGVHELPKGSGAISKGATVYWNGTQMTTTATDNTEAGYAFRAATSGDSVVHVKLRG